MVAASADLTYLNGLTPEGVGLKDASGAVLPRPKAKSTGMLTVWRKLHVEVDSMEMVLGNHLTGNIIAVKEAYKGLQTLCIDKTLREKPFHYAGNGYRFTGGQIIINSTRFAVESASGDGEVSPCENTVSVHNDQLVSIPVGASFILYDDDDWNNSHGAILDGDGPLEDIEPLPNRTFRLMESSNDPARNVFAAAYIMPVIDGGGDLKNNQSSLTFRANIDFGDSWDTQVLSKIGSAGSESDDYWIVYLQLAYQDDVSNDADPNWEGGRGGVTNHGGQSSLFTTDRVTGPNVPLGAQGSVVFMETCMEREKYFLSLPDPPATPDWTIRTAPHEIGHQMALAGDDRESRLGIMSYKAAPVFVPTHINVLRWRVKSPGK